MKLWIYKVHFCSKNFFLRKCSDPSADILTMRPTRYVRKRKQPTPS
jgi:hypothetical protein